jgi:hypothetical protein
MTVNKPASVGHIWWDEHGVTGWRKDEDGYVTQIYRHSDGRIIPLLSVGKNDDGGLAIIVPLKTPKEVLP